MINSCTGCTTSDCRENLRTSYCTVHTLFEISLQRELNKPGRRVLAYSPLECQLSLYRRGFFLFFLMCVDINVQGQSKDTHLAFSEKLFSIEVIKQHRITFLYRSYKYFLQPYYVMIHSTPGKKWIHFRSVRWQSFPSVASLISLWNWQRKGKMGKALVQTVWGPGLLASVMDFLQQHVVVLGKIFFCH